MKRVCIIALLAMSVSAVLARDLLTELYVRRANASSGWADPISYLALWEMETTNTVAMLDSSGYGTLNHATNMPDVATGPVQALVGTNVYGRLEYAASWPTDNDEVWLSPTNQIVGNVSFSVCAWFHIEPDGGPIRRSFISGGSIESGQGYWLGREDNYKVIWGPSGSYATYTAAGIDDGLWHLVVGTYSDSGVWELYMDGVLAHMATSSIAVAAVPELRLGDAIEGYSEWCMKGYLDHVGIISGVLASNLVLELYQNTCPTNNVRVRQ